MYAIKILALLTLWETAVAPIGVPSPRRPSANPLKATMVIVDQFSRPELAAVVRRLHGETIIGFKRADLSPELVSATLDVLERSLERTSDDPSVGIYLSLPEG